jgi:hypothetical protein
MGPRSESMAMSNSSPVEQKIRVANAATRNNSRNRGSIIDQIM